MCSVHSAFFMVQLSLPYMTTGKAVAVDSILVLVDILLKVDSRAEDKCVRGESSAYGTTLITQSNSHIHT